MYYFLLKFSLFVHTRQLAKLSPTSLIFLLRHLLSESGRFLQQRMTERKQCENPSVRNEGKFTCSNKAHKRKAGEGEGIGSPSNKLVYTKRQKDIYANRKHKTTIHGRRNPSLRWGVRVFEFWVSSRAIDFSRAPATFDFWLKKNMVKWNSNLRPPS